MQHGSGESTQNAPRRSVRRPLYRAEPGTELFPHHLEGDTYNFSAPLAQVVANPLGLRNLSANKWTSRTADGTLAEVLPGQMLSLASDCRVNFGHAQAEVRVG